VTPTSCDRGAAGHNRADTVDGGEAASVLGDASRDPLSDRLDPSIGVPDFIDHVPGEMFAGRLDLPDRSNAGEQTAGCGCGEIRRRTSWQQITQQRVQLVDQPGALGDQVVPTFVEQP
jgi:hypothetical protein